MAKSAKTPKVYTIEVTRIRLRGGDSITSCETGTLEELKQYFGYTLEAGASYNGMQGCKKVNRDPKSISALVTNLNKIGRAHV